jgi:hypothetical protein
MKLTTEDYAKKRYDIFRAYLLENRAGGEFLPSFALMEVLKDLTNRGITVGDALLYIQLVWDASKSLDYAVTAAQLAQKLRRHEEAIRRSIRGLVKAGLIHRLQFDRYAFKTLTAFFRDNKEGQDCRTGTLQAGEKTTNNS